MISIYTGRTLGHSWTPFLTLQFLPYLFLSGGLAVDFSLPTGSSWSWLFSPLAWWRPWGWGSLWSLCPGGSLPCLALLSCAGLPTPGPTLPWLGGPTWPWAKEPWIPLLVGVWLLGGGVVGRVACHLSHLDLGLVGLSWLPLGPSSSLLPGPSLSGPSGLSFFLLFGGRGS